VFKELTAELLEMSVTERGRCKALYAHTVYLCCSCSCCWGN
jgi:hypothetical protein